MFSLQAQSIVDNVRANVASDVMVLAPFYGDPLDQKGMTEFLEAEMNKPKGERVLDNYSFVTFPMWLIPDVRHNWVSNLAELPWFHLQFFGTDRDFLNTIFSEYLLVTETCDQFEYDGLLSDSSKPDVVKSLYDFPRQQLLPVEKDSGLLIPPSVLSGRNPSSLSTSGEVFYYRNNSETYTDFIEVFGSEALRYSMYVDTDSPMIMDLSANFILKSTIDFRYLLKMRAMAKKAPGFLFSSYKQTAFASHMIITMDSFQELINRIYEMRRTGLLDSGFSPEEANDKISGLPSSPNMNRLLMKLVDGFNATQSETLQNGIRNFVTNDITVIFDTASLLSTTDVATEALIAFFDLVSVIAAVLCFFVLWLSFTSNIRENSWEFGVLRAVGLSAAQVIRVYIYEALAIIITALVLGSICGLMLAVTLTLQFNLFTEMPFSFQFPYFLFFSVLILSLSVAIGGSYLAARHIKNREIAQVLKGGG